VEIKAFTALLLYVRRVLAHHETLSLDMPFGVAEEALRAAGFQDRRTLVWMQLDKTIFDIMRR